jgi:hypothetical protein
MNTVTKKWDENRRDIWHWYNIKKMAFQPFTTVVIGACLQTKPVPSTPHCISFHPKLKDGENGDISHATHDSVPPHALLGSPGAHPT